VKVSALEKIFRFDFRDNLATNLQVFRRSLGFGDPKFRLRSRHLIRRRLSTHSQGAWQIAAENSENPHLDS
jgi:hypothetical protein